MAKETDKSFPQAVTAEVRPGTIGVSEVAQIVEPRIDTDSLVNRWKRIENQATVENRLGDFNNLSFLDRTTQIRSGLFAGFANVKGDPVAAFRTRGLSEPSIHATAEKIEKYMSGLGSFVDRVATQIAILPEDQQPESALRLGSVVIALGFAIHPHSDGNTQTYKMAGLSYLHQFKADTDPEGNQLFFRYLLHNGSGKWFVTEETDINENIPQVLANANPSLGMLPNALSEKAEKFISAKTSLDFPARVEPQRRDEAARFLEQDVTQEERITFSMIEKKYWEEQREGCKMGWENAEIRNFEANLDYLLYSQQGLEFLSNFVRHDDKRKWSDLDVIRYQSSNLYVLRELLKTMPDLLEPKEQHTQRYGELHELWMRQMEREKNRPERPFNRWSDPDDRYFREFFDADSSDDF